MKHWLVRICVLLVLGAIVNVAVAWVCVLNPWRAKQHVSHDGLDLAQEQRWWRSVAPSSMDEPGGFARLSIPGFEQILLTGEFRSATNLPANEVFLEQTIRVQAGLPLRGFQGALFIYRQPPPNSLLAQELAWLIRPPDALISRQVRHQRPHFPFMPLWPGFAINTVFYAGVLWLLFAAPFALRRRRRIKRGLCPKCAYPVGTNERCTECGATVNRIAR